jgi:hypothetical protein
VAWTTWSADKLVAVGQSVPPGQRAGGAQPAVPFVARRVPVEVQNPNALREQRGEEGESISKVAPHCQEEEERRFAILEGRGRSSQGINGSSGFPPESSRPAIQSVAVRLPKLCAAASGHSRIM